LTSFTVVKKRAGGKEKKDTPNKHILIKLTEENESWNKLPKQVLWGEKEGEGEHGSRGVRVFAKGLTKIVQEARYDKSTT